MSTLEEQDEYRLSPRLKKSFIKSSMILGCNLSEFKVTIPSKKNFLDSELVKVELVWKLDENLRLGLTFKNAKPYITQTFNGKPENIPVRWGQEFPPALHFSGGSCQLTQEESNRLIRKFPELSKLSQGLLLERFISSLKNAVEKCKQNVIDATETLKKAELLLVVQPQLDFGSKEQSEQSENTANYQFDKLQLSIVAYDDEHTIQLQLKWLGDEPVKIFLLEEQEPVQKSMGNHFAEFFFDPSLPHTIVTQDANGREIYRLPLDKVE